MLKTLIATGLAVASAAAFAGAAPAMQDAHNWYVGVGLNYNAIGTEKYGDAKLDKRGWGGNAFVGYHVNKYFGTEFGFDVMGQNKYKDADASVKVKNRWDVHFVGNAYLPVTDWFSPFAFAGAAWVNEQQDVTGTFEVDSHSAESAKYSGMAAIYGGGLQFNIQDFGIRAKYTRFDMSNDIPAAQDMVSLDVLYRFGM